MTTASPFPPLRYRLSGVRQDADSWKAVNGVAPIDDPPFFGEASVRTYAVELRVATV
jgi:hypothetical protein